MIKCVVQTVASTDSRESGIEGENKERQRQSRRLMIIQAMMMKSPRQQGQFHEVLVKYEGRYQLVDIWDEEITVAGFANLGKNITFLLLER